MRYKELSRTVMALSLAAMLSFSWAQPALAESAAEAMPYTAAAKSVSTTTESAPAASSVTTAATKAVFSTRQYVVITGSNVNLRRGAGTSFAKVGTAKKGAKYVYLARKKAKNGKVWYQVQYSSSKTAWVISSYSRVETKPPETTTASFVPSYVVITGSNVNLRRGAGTSFAKIGAAQKGAKYTYLASKKATSGKIWYQVQYMSSKKAWVISTYARRVNNDVSFSPYLTRTVTVNKGRQPVYSEPDAKSKRVGTVNGGAKYTVVEWADDGKTTWYAFNLKGKRVWISRYHTTVSDRFRSIPVKDFSDGSVPTIYLSPSKQPQNSYAFGNTNEQKEMYRVAAELQKILEKEYVCTVYTAPTDLFLSLDGRALDAYNRHADVYLAIHSNADGSSAKKSYGAVGYYQPNSSQSKKLAENIVKEMGKIAPRRSNVKSSLVNGMSAFDGIGYSDVRDPAYYGITSVLAEVEYHDNADSAKWIIHHPHQIARALANALESAFQLQRRS